MNSRSLLALLLIGLLAGTAFFLAGGGDAADRPDQAPDPDRTGPVVKDRQGATGSGPEAGIPDRTRLSGSVDPSAGEPEGYRRALSGLRGRLIWERSRKPLAGVEVKVVEVWLDAIVPTLEDFVGVEKMRSPLVFRSRTVTDGEGEFVLRGIHGRAEMVLAIGLRTEVAAIRVVPRNPAPGELVDMGDIEIVERGTVTGRVVDAAGAPVVGARVRIGDVPPVALQFGIEQFDPEGMALIAQGPYRVVLELPHWLAEYDAYLPFGDGRTDEQGRFEIRGVPPGSPTLLVNKPGMAATARRGITVLAEIAQDVGSVTLGEGEFVSGRFVDSDGAPVPGVQVTAGAVMALLPGGLLQKPRLVGADGRFEISGLPRGAIYVCYRRGPRKPWEVSGPHRGDDEVKLVLGALREGTVRLQPEVDAALSGVRFDLYIADVSAYLPGFETHVPGEGHFVRDPEQPLTWRVKDLPAGIYKVIAKAAGFAFGTGVLDMTKAESRDRTAVIVLQKAPVTRFEVRDESGAAVHGARVYWNASPGRESETRGRQRLTRLPILVGITGADGVLVVDSLERGAKRFYARHPLYALGLSEQVVEPGRPIRIALGRTGSVAGEVAENGRPPRTALSVLAVPDRDLGRRFAGVLMPRLATPGPDGRFAFANMQPGKWLLRAVEDMGSLKTPADFLRFRENRTGQAPAVEVEVRPGEAGYVLLDAAVPPATRGGTLVGSVRIGGEPARGVWVQTWGGRNRAEVADNGTFELTGLEDGELWIGIERAGHDGFLPNRIWEGRVTITGGSRAALHVDVQVADVVVEVVDAVGRAVGGVGLELLGASRQTGEHTGRVRISGVTDGSGTVRYAAVPEGDFVIRSTMQRDPVLVLPEVPVRVFSGRPVNRRITAVAPVEIAGVVQWDESGLQDDLSREYARKHRPTYLVFESDGLFTWGPVVPRDGQDRFELRKAAPGTYRLSRGGALDWTSAPLVIGVEASRDTTVRLRPDPAKVRAAVDALRPKAPEKSQGKDGSKGGKRP